MTRTRPVPPLPQPEQPAAAAQTLAAAAQAAADVWAQPLDSAQHKRAVSQLYSTLRDLGIAARSLAAWQALGMRPGSESPEFARQVTAGARRILDACNCLDGVLAFEGLGPLPYPDEPGAALCHAARNAISAWRQPSGTSADRDTTIWHVIAATRSVSASALNLAVGAPRHHAIGLQTAFASLAEAISDLSATIEETAARDDGVPRPLLGNHRPGTGETL